MCKIQNQYACQCLGETEAAFTQQDVRSCPCPSIVKVYQVRRPCEQCRRPEKKHTRKWTGIGSRRFGYQSKSQETHEVDVTREQGNLQRRGSSATTSTGLHPHSMAEEQSVYYTPQSISSNLQPREKDKAPWTLGIFTSSTWNTQCQQEAFRVGRWAICAEADVVKETNFHYDEHNDATRQQIIDQIEVLLGQLTGLHLSGLVMKACKASLPK